MLLAYTKVSMCAVDIWCILLSKARASVWGLWLHSFLNWLHLRFCLYLYLQFQSLGWLIKNYYLINLPFSFSLSFFLSFLPLRGAQLVMFEGLFRFWKFPKLAESFASSKSSLHLSYWQLYSFLLLVSCKKE